MLSFKNETIRIFCVNVIFILFFYYFSNFVITYVCKVTIHKGVSKNDIHDIHDNYIKWRSNENKMTYMKWRSNEDKMT